MRFVPAMFCNNPFQRLKFTPDGNVTMCCFQQRGCMGNILQYPLEDIWYGQVADEVRNCVAAGTLHPFCKVPSCPLYYREKKAGRRLKIVRLPTQFEIDLPIQHCNIGGERPTEDHPACLMCERRLPFIPQEDRLEEVCRKLQRYMKDLTSLHIQGVAEPFWKDRIYEVAKWLKFSRYHIHLSTTTNGTLMGTQNRKRFLSFPLSTITWSLDAATSETHRQIRRVRAFEQIVDNIKAYNQERNRKRHFLRIHNNINLINIAEVVQMVQLAAEIGVDCVDFNPTYGVPGICVNRRNFRVFRDAQYAIEEAAKKWGIHATFMRNLALEFSESTVIPFL